MRVKEICSQHYSTKKRHIQYITIRFAGKMVSLYLLVRVCVRGWSYFSLPHVKAGQESRATRESSEYLKNLMQPAVSLQKGNEHVITTDLTPSTKACTLL